MTSQEVGFGVVQAAGDHRHVRSTALARQQWLSERVSVLLLHLHCVCCVCCLLDCGRDSATVVRRKKVQFSVSQSKLRESQGLSDQFPNDPWIHPCNGCFEVYVLFKLKQ